MVRKPIVIKGTWLSNKGYIINFSWCIFHRSHAMWRFSKCTKMQPAQVGRSINVRHISATKKNAQVIATEVFSLAFLLSRNLIIKHRTIMFEDHTLQAAHTHTHTHIYIGFSKLCFLRSHRNFSVNQRQLMYKIFIVTNHH